MIFSQDNTSPTVRPGVTCSQVVDAEKYVEAEQNAQKDGEVQGSEEKQDDGPVPENPVGGAFSFAQNLYHVRHCHHAMCKLEHHVDKEHPLVALANARAHPQTVVVKSRHALVADFAVLAAKRLNFTSKIT